jgi:hypothetical protein
LQQIRQEISKIRHDDDNDEAPRRCGLKEDDELQKKIEQQARQIEELQRLHQQTNQKLLNPNDTQAQANNDLWFDKGAKQVKESMEWGLALTKQMNREAAELEAERAKLQHKNYMKLRADVFQLKHLVFQLKHLRILPYFHLRILPYFHLRLLCKHQLQLH